MRANVTINITATDPTTAANESHNYATNKLGVALTAMLIAAVNNANLASHGGGGA
ncbi:hypothetical protein GCM10007169_16640 [Shewanella fodinae]|nr:hypothetical protein GCM10007169_16640 [Shewanella fodinae]